MIKRAPSGRRVGESHQNSKLTETRVREIRRLHARGCGGYLILGRRFGVNWCTIRDVITYRTWKHVKE